MNDNYVVALGLHSQHMNHNIGSMDVRAGPYSYSCTQRKVCMHNAGYLLHRRYLGNNRFTSFPVDVLNTLPALVNV